MTPPKQHGLPCMSECREEIIGMIAGCVTSSGIWKFAGLFVTIITTVLLISISVHSEGQSARDIMAKENYDQVKTNTVVIAETKKDLAYLKEGQHKIENNANENFDKILKVIKTLKR